jgi:polyisoprenoid-binding protein YceI
MKTINTRLLLMTFGVAVTTAIAQPATPANAQTVLVDKGVASFQVTTNIPALEVSGKSSALQARVQLHRDPSGLTLDRIDAWMPVKTLVTGMTLRDEHMRRRVFTTTGGDVPDLRFESGKIECPGVAPGHEATCTIAGNLSIRGVAHGFSIPLKVRQEGNGSAFRASGEGTLKLSDYGIEQPSQLGVKTANEVKLHFDLSGKEGGPVTAAMGRP